MLGVATAPLGRHACASEQSSPAGDLPASPPQAPDAYVNDHSDVNDHSYVNDHSDVNDQMTGWNDQMTGAC